MSGGIWDLKCDTPKCEDLRPATMQSIRFSIQNYKCVYDETVLELSTLNDLAGVVRNRVTGCTSGVADLKIETDVKYALRWEETRRGFYVL